LNSDLGEAAGREGKKRKHLLVEGKKRRRLSRGKKGRRKDVASQKEQRAAEKTKKKPAGGGCASPSVCTRAEKLKHYLKSSKKGGRFEKAQPWGNERYSTAR